MESLAHLKQAALFAKNLSAAAVTQQTVPFASHLAGATADAQRTQRRQCDLDAEEFRRTK